MDGRFRQDGGSNEMSENSTTPSPPSRAAPAQGRCGQGDVKQRSAVKVGNLLSQFPNFRTPASTTLTDLKTCYSAHPTLNNARHNLSSALIGGAITSSREA